MYALVRVVYVSMHIRYLLNHMKFLDRSRVGVWGKGFGGYVTAMILGSNKKVFKCGVAVSPITDWIYYSELFSSSSLSSSSP